MIEVVFEGQEVNEMGAGGKYCCCIVFVAPFVANQGPCTESYICLVRVNSQQELCQHKGGCWMWVQLELANLSFSTLASKIYRSPRYEICILGQSQHSLHPQFLSPLSLGWLSSVY
jgi:hypothetical protein